MAFYDVILRGGTVIDPGAGLHGRLDVGISGGKIASVAPDLPRGDADHVVDLSGLYVTPGLIDLHTHAYWGGTDLGVLPDRDCLPRGVTTMVDCGSAGAYTFLGFRKLIMETSRTRLLAFLNLSTIGQVDIRVGELTNLTWADREAAARCLAENRDLLLGLKVRLNRDVVGQNGLLPLEMAREVADRLGVKVMIHIGDTDAPLTQILELMRAGDIVSHVFTHHQHGIMEAGRRILPAVRQAVNRGVWMDVAPGRINLSYRVARAAFKAGWLPHTLSTDVTRYGFEGIVKDLPHILSSFMALGLSLQQVIERATSYPARALGLSDEIGSLRPGCCADVAVFALEEGEYQFVDATGEVLVGKQHLAPRLVLRAGVPVG
jgi:dihydroorotase